MNTIIPKERIVALNNPDIIKREYDAIIAEIDNRVTHIWKTLMKISGRKLDWYAFQNDVDLGRGNGSTGGQFDPKTDSEFIELGGEYSRRDVDGDFQNGFPTRFLWTEDSVWQQEVLSHIEQNRQATNKKYKNEQQKKNAMIVLIKQKLTAEELKYISFR
jgi:hypothetical protein